MMPKGVNRCAAPDVISPKPVSEPRWQGPTHAQIAEQGTNEMGVPRLCRGIATWRSLLSFRPADALSRRTGAYLLPGPAFACYANARLAFPKSRPLGHGVLTALPKNAIVFNR